MKKIFIKTIVIIMIFTILSCTTMSPEMLYPDQDPIAMKLLPLRIGLSDENIIKTEAINTTTYQSETATLFERELEGNIFQDQREDWGFIEFKTTFENSSFEPGAVVLVALHIVSLGALTLLGLPYAVYIFTKEVEITVFDSKKSKIKTYRYLETGNYSVGLYNEESNSNLRIIRAKLVKTMLSKFRKDIEEDVEYINSELIEVGSL